MNDNFDNSRTDKEMLEKLEEGFMEVKDLIEYLKKFPMNAAVIFKARLGFPYDEKIINYDEDLNEVVIG
jgi:hypothetical protein